MPKTWWVNQSKSTRGDEGFAIVWAPLTSDGDRRVAHWDRLAEASGGDLILHYSQGAVRGFSIVLAPARNAISPFEPGAWGTEGRRLDVDYSPLDIPIPLSEVPLGKRLDEPKPHSVFDRRGQVVQGYFFAISEDLARTIMALRNADLGSEETEEGPAFTINGQSDRTGTATYRTEQPALRRALLNGRSAAECGFCGQELPAKYLVAAHIKPRSECNESERADPNVAVLACLFGCDAAFEHGDLYVNEGGTLQVQAANPKIRDLLERLEGHPTPGLTPQNERYFRSHAKIHSRE